jgi:hypothetical protein
MSVPVLDTHVVATALSVTLVRHTSVSFVCPICQTLTHSCHFMSIPLSDTHRFHFIRVHQSDTRVHVVATLMSAPLSDTVAMSLCRTLSPSVFSLSDTNVITTSMSVLCLSVIYMHICNFQECLPVCQKQLVLTRECRVCQKHIVLLPWV